MNEIPFTRLPTKLIFALDSDLVKMLALLIQQESYWSNKKRLDNNSYFKSMDEFAAVFRKSNKQDVRLMLQTLQSNKFIEIIPSEKRNHPNHYRICWNKIAEYNDLPIEELLKSPMIRTAKRTSKRKIEDSAVSYQQKENDSTETYQQDSEMIVQDCTTTIDNIIINKNNNNTIDNSELTKSPLYEQYKTRIEETLADYQQESDYIVALDKFSNIESFLELATKHIPTNEIELYNSQLSEASIAHERRGWNVLLDNITDDMMQRYHITNIHNVKTPSNPQQFKIILNDLLGKTDLYISSEYWEELTASIEKWIIHQWERSIISYDLQQEYIDKIYSKMAS